MRKRTKITRALCRKRTGDAVTRAEHFGDLITADHKVLSEGCQSRNNHRHAVVLQDLANQWIQFYPCKTKTSQETEKSSRKFLEPSEKPKVIYTDNSLEFGISCEQLSWNHCASTSHRSETNGIAERAVRRIGEGTSAVLLHSGLDEKMVGGFHGVLLFCAKCSRPHIRWEKHLVNGERFRLAPWLNIILFLRKTSEDSINLVRKCYLEYSLDMH